MTDYSYIKTAGDLARFCDEIAAEPRIAVDTEFIGDRRYFRRLEILQIATPAREAIVDYQAITGGGGDRQAMEPLWVLFRPGGPELVFHASLEDARVINQEMGALPAGVFDTQAAFSLIDTRLQIGYLDLVAALCDARLDKGPQMMDWSRRPLTDEMIRYALDDVRYLLPLRSKILARLDKLGRLPWLDDVLAHLLEDIEDPNPREAYRRVKGGGALSGRQMAVLRELAAWREELAMDRDEPPARIMADDILIAIARKSPTSEHALAASTRRLNDHIVRRYGRELLAAVAEGQRQPALEKNGGRRPPGEYVKGLVSLLQSFVEATAQRESIAPQRVVRSSELTALAGAEDAEELEQLPVLQGWRRDLLGAELLEIVRGESLLRWNPQAKCLEVRPHE